MTLAVDGETIPAEFAPHQHLEGRPETTDDPHPFHYGREAPTGRAWWRCGCGWEPGAPDPDDPARRLPVPAAEAFLAWARHVPAGFHAWQDARARWLADHGLATIPAGRVWDVGEYDWRTWTTEITDDPPRITVRAA